jgi:hypothetical protein
MKPALGLINTSVAMILAIGCVACVEPPASSTGAIDVLEARREMLAAGGAAGRVIDPAAFGAAIASSSSSAIPGCEHVIALDAAGSGQFTASASLSCEAVTEFLYIDVAAYAVDPVRGTSVLLTATAAEENNGTFVETEITGPVPARPGQTLVVDSLAITVDGEEFALSFQSARPTP